MVTATPGALAALESVGQAPIDYIRRHARGDWGEALGEEDKRANADALCNGTRLLSAYFLPNGEKLWVITEALIDPDTGERGGTCVLRPEDY
jgi:hypothetical protein